MKVQVLAAALLCSAFSVAHAQQNANGNGANDNGGVFPLPQGVNRVIAIDAHNSLIAELEDPDTGEKRLAPVTVRYVYAGGIARLFGGEVIPAEQFVSPAFNNQNGGGFNNGGNNNGGFGNNNGFGNNRNGFGNQNGFGNNFGNGFNGNQNGFGNNGFGNNGFGQNNFNNFNRGLNGNYQIKPNATRR